MPDGKMHVPNEIRYSLIAATAAATKCVIRLARYRTPTGRMTCRSRTVCHTSDGLGINDHEHEIIASKHVPGMCETAINPQPNARIYADSKACKVLEVSVIWLYSNEGMLALANIRADGDRNKNKDAINMLAHDFSKHTTASNVHLGALARDISQAHGEHIVHEMHARKTASMTIIT